MVFKNRKQNTTLELYNIPLSSEELILVRLSVRTRIQHIEDNVVTGYPSTKKALLKRYSDLDAKLSHIIRTQIEGGEDLI